MGHSQFTGGGYPNWFDPTNLWNSHQWPSYWFPEVKPILNVWYGPNSQPDEVRRLSLWWSIWISCSPWDSHSCREEFLKCKCIFLCFLPPHPFVPHSYVTCELIIAFSSLCEGIRRLPSFPYFSKSVTFSSIGRHLKSALYRHTAKLWKQVSTNF